MSVNEMSGLVRSALANETQLHHQSLPTIFKSTPPAPTVFPPEHAHETHTTASYSKEPIPELVNSNKGNWTFTLQVPIPAKVAYPTLASLKYDVNYGAAHGHSMCAVQTRITLTKKPVPHGIIIDPPKEGLSRVAVGLPSQTCDGAPVVCLSSVPAVKEAPHASKRDHYVDKQQILPHVRILEDSHLYLHVDVTETPSAHMRRSLKVNVSATWVEDAQAKAMHERIKAAEAKMHTAEKSAEHKQAVEVQARLEAERKSAVARQAKDRAEQMEKAAKKKSADDQHAKKHADEQAVADRLVKERADSLADSNRRAKEVADAAAESHNKARELAEKKAQAEHQAEGEAEERAKKYKAARSAIEHQR